MTLTATPIIAPPWYSSGLSCPQCGHGMDVIVDDLYYPEQPYPDSAGYAVGCDECGHCTDWHRSEEAARQAVPREDRMARWANYCEYFTWQEFNDLLDSGIDPDEQIQAKIEDARNGIDPYGDYELRRSHHDRQ